MSALNLMNENLDHIRAKFDGAKDVRHRINSDDFLVDLLLAHKYDATFAELQQFNYLTNLDQSQIGKVTND